MRICPNAATQKQRKKSAYPWKASNRKKNKNKNKTREYSLQRKGKKNLYIYINSENCPAEERENKKKLTPSIESFAQFCHKIS